MSDFSASLGEGQLALRINEGVSKPVELLKLFLPGILAGCIDYEAGVCDFSDEFAKLLELCRDMPVLYQSGLASPTMYNNDELLLCQMDISGFIEYMFIKSISFPDAPITPIGYPRSGDGNGTVIEPSVSLAITKQSRQPEGAWKFISFCLDSQIEDWRSSRENANSSMSLLGRGRPRGRSQGLFLRRRQFAAHQTSTVGGRGRPRGRSQGLFLRRHQFAAHQTSTVGGEPPRANTRIFLRRSSRRLAFARPPGRFVCGKTVTATADV